MTSLIQQDRSQTLRRAAVRAKLTPSVHNTQPWRFVLSGNALEYGDGLQASALCGRQAS